MNDREDRLFDEKLRNAFADYEEAVPEGLWDGIASGLDRMDRKKKIAGMFWKVACAAATVSAAAAVALFVILRPGSGDSQNYSDGESYVAQNSMSTTPDDADNSNGNGGSDSPHIVQNDPVAVSVADNDAPHIDHHSSSTAAIADNDTQHVAHNEPAAVSVADNDAQYIAQNNSSEAVDGKVASSAADNTASILKKNDNQPYSDTCSTVEKTGTQSNSNTGSVIGKTDTQSDEDKTYIAQNETAAVSTTDNSYPTILDESDFADIDEKPTKKVRMALAMAGNTSVNIDRSVQSIRRYAPPTSITPTETILSERTDNVNYSLPVTVGVGVKVFFAKRWAIGTGVNYTLLSKKVKVDYTEVDEESGVVTKDITTTMKNDQHYIGVPLNIYFSIIRNNYWDFYTYIGGAVDKCVANKYRSISGTDPFSYTRKTSGVQPSVNLGLGIEFCPVKNIGIFIDPNLSYFFDCKQPRSIRTIQPLTFSASAGVRFRI